jgi:uroporphyrin-III C-methyltransferase
MATGKVWLVGAGSGAPDLLTLRAARVLQQADIVFHDALVNPQVLELAAVAKRQAVGKRCGELSSTQRFINRRLIEAARRYANVVRLKGGDPMLFGRAQEEIDALQQAGIEVEVVPGVSAMFAASATLNRSLTRRGLSRSVVVLTPRIGQGCADHDWARAALCADTAVLYMAARQAQAITRALLAVGMSAQHPVVLVENASLPDERVITATLGELPACARELGHGPALVMMGEVYAGLMAQVQALQPKVA